MELGGSWSTQQLVEFLSVLGSATDERSASRLAVDRAAAAFGAEVCALVRAGQIVASAGVLAGKVPGEWLMAVATGRESAVDLDGAGRCHTLVVPLEDGDGGCLLVARSGPAAFSSLESSLLRGMGRAVALSVRALGLLERERALREESQRRAAEALRDPLTGLANRSKFLERLGAALIASRAGGDRLGVLFLDLDRFKIVNDSFGFNAGDELLLGVSTRLQECLREGEVAARLGGDEFAILVDAVFDATDLVPLAERVMACFRSPFRVGSRQVTATASLGIAIGDGWTTDAVDLLRDADVAMYIAKAAGSGRCTFFEPAMQEAVRNGVELEADLRHALSGRRLSVAYQPIIDLRTGDIVGAEALARWTHQVRGPVPPSVFIPLAETSGLISGLGTFVLEEACREAVTWHPARGAGRSARSQPAPEPYVSVNMSPQQLLDPGLIAQVTATLAAVGLDPGRLVLEITEQTMMHRSGEAIAQLQALKNLGVRIAVDDFGIGYSSLSYLARFPVDILKIDKSFIDGIATPSTDADLAAAIVRLGQSLQLETVAEGVETPEQLEVLDRLGCDFGQGYLFARPAPPEGLLRLRQGPPRGRRCRVGSVVI